MKTVELLDKYFETAFAAPDGIKRLRELILTLAMQGKLVPQNPNDQPASELLKEIEVEKKRLIKEKKIKKSKPLPEITPDEIPYDLPDSWEWVKIGNIGNIFNGNSINSSIKETKYLGAVGFPYIATKDIGYGFDKFDYQNGVFIPENEEKFKIAHQEAILICSEGGSAGKKCGIAEQDICFVNKLFANEPFGNIPSKFILYIYLSPVFKSLFQKLMTGIIGGVSMNKFIGITIPLPPLEEQHRIVEKVDRLMEQVDRLEKLQEERDRKQLIIHAAASDRLLNAPDKNSFNDAWNFIQNNFNELYSVKENISELRKAILQLAVMGKLVPQNPNDSPASELLKEIKAEKKRLIKEGKIKKQKPLPEIQPEEIPYDLPQSWKWIKLGDITVFSNSGWSPQCLKRTRIDDEWGVLKVSSVSWGTFNPNENKALPRSMQPRKEIEVKVGDFLLSRANTEDLVARSVVVLKTPSKLMMSDKIVRLNLSNQINKTFINIANTSCCSRNYYANHASGTSSSMKNVSREVIYKLPIPLPPLPEQHRIVAKVDRLMALCDQLEAQLTKRTEKQTALLNEVIAAI